ncbi:MAG TPA: four helix bundle protein [Candidatus Paceibacterota bacterium]|nr:four helix bundle protein [Candidatus Paceibacterota bacterium]
MVIKSHKELFVWQKSIELTLTIYKLTSSFPPEELYGLTSQMRRAAVSISSNVAEGRYRGTRKDFVNFLRTALGSCAEIETQVHIAKQLSWLQEKDSYGIENLISEISKMLTSMIKKLNMKLEARS